MNRTLALLAALATGAAGAQQHHMPDAGAHAADARVAAAADTRTAVRFPPQLRDHTLANMRDHLTALKEIHAALAAGQYDLAAEVAEGRIGMSSLALHGAHEVARYMPAGMQQAGTAMHHASSRFAVAARDAAVTGDLRAPLRLLAEVTTACVACHAGYRFE